MRHCQKIANGRSPSVRSHEEWNNFTKEVDQITGFTVFEDFSTNFGNMWLSATEGDQNNKLTTLNHWQETDSSNNQCPAGTPTRPATRYFFPYPTRPDSVLEIMG